jgi:hypothetical protein
MLMSLIGCDAGLRSNLPNAISFARSALSKSSPREARVAP